jgi:PAS domain S-box-containing protein
MAYLENFWDTISTAGITAEQSASDVKRLKLTNRFGIIAFIFTFPYLLAFFYFGYTTIAWFLAACSIMYCLVPVFSFLKRYNLAKLSLYITVLIHQFIVASVFGRAAEIHLIYIALILLPIVLYDTKKQIAWVMFYIVITVAVLCVLYVTNFSLLSIHASGRVTTILSWAYNITTMAGVIVILCTSLFVAERAEKILDVDNMFLQLQLRAIFDSSYDALFLVDNEKRRIIKVNRRATELFEMSENDLMGKYGLDLHKNTPQEKELNEIRSSLATAGQYQSEILYGTGKGNEFWGAIAIRQITIRAKKYQVVRITDITEQHEINERLKSSLHEKEILLAEIHHRVKNNMAVISGLLGVQSSYVKDEQARTLFEESRNRIHSMALIHDKLYQHEAFAKIDFCAYIGDLVSYIRSSYDPGTSDITFSVSCNDIYLDIKQAVPCGLILNELISNAYKHAFKDKEKGEIKVACTKMGERFTMMVSDNGKGFDLMTALEAPSSLGLTLINGLIEQVSGAVKGSHHDGTAFYLSFEA